MAADVSIEDINGVAIPLMLWDDPRTGKAIRTAWQGGSAPVDLSWTDWKNGLGFGRAGIVDDGYHYGEFIDARSPGLVMPAGELTELDLSGIANVGAASDSFVFGGHFYLLAGRRMVKVANGTGTISEAGDAGSGQVFVTAAIASYSNTIFAWIGIDNGFAKFDGSTLTKTTSFIRTRVATTYWTTTDGVSVQRLVAADSSYTFKHVPMTSDPMTGGNWSSSITIGPGSYALTWLVPSGRHVYLSTPGGIWDLNDLNETVNLTPSATEDESNPNGVPLVSAFYDGHVLFGRENGIDAVDVSQPGLAQPAASWAMPGAAIGLPNESPIWGRPVAFAPEAGWMAVAVYDGTTSRVIYGRRRARLGYAGPGEWIWHGAMAVFENQLVCTMKAMTVVQNGVLSRRLFIATRPDPLTATCRLYWQSIPYPPTARQDLIHGGDHRFSPTATLSMTPKDGGEPLRDKLVIDGDVDGQDLSFSSNLSVGLALDGADPVDLGLAASAPTKLSVLDTEVSGRQVAPVVTFTGMPDAPPSLTAVTLRVAVQRELEEIVEIEAELEREGEEAGGARPGHKDPHRVYHRTAQQQNRTTTYTDPLGVEYLALVNPGISTQFRQIEQGHTGAKSAQRRGWIRTMQLSLRLLTRIWRYDDNAHYDEATYS